MHLRQHLLHRGQAIFGGIDVHWKHFEDLDEEIQDVLLVVDDQVGRARGERPADLDAIATNIVNLSCLIRDFPEIQELDINPLMVMEKGAVALDARIIFKQPEK